MVQLLLESVWTPREPRVQPHRLSGLKRGRKSSTHCTNTKWQNKELLQPYLGSNQLQECEVHGKHIDVRVDGSLVKGTSLAMELVQAGLAHGVRAT